MKVCLACPSSRKFLKNEYYKCKFFLESFYSMEDWLIPIIKSTEFFMLDSGAFSFMNNQKGNSVDFDSYLNSYIEFINKNDIQYFFELDVDSIVGIKEVERLRQRLEKETGKKCIPVWHKSRGKEYFIQMCKDYEYVAIGGIVTKEITPKDYKYFKWFIDTAHHYGCKIHGLGFSSTKWLPVYNFDSVDSTSWQNGGRFGVLYYFDGYTIKEFDVKNRKRRNDLNTNLINEHNYNQWLKYQYFAEKYL